MDINELLRAGSDIFDDVMYAVEKNQYEDLGSKISGRIYEASQSMGFPGASQNTETDKTVYTGTVEKTDRKDGVYRTNFMGKPPYKSPAPSKSGGQKVTGGQAPPKAQGSRPGPASAKTHGSGQLYSQKIGAYARPAQDTRYMTKPGNRRQMTVTPFFRGRISQNAGLPQTITGGVLFVPGFLLLLLCIVLMIRGEAVGLQWLPFFSATTLVTALMIGKGKAKQKLTALYYRIGNLIGNAEFVPLKRLASDMGESETKLKKQIQKMMNKGYLPFARFDDAQTTLMLTDRAYSQYMQAENSRMEREKEKVEKTEPTHYGESDLVKEGRAYIKKVREYNDLIPDDRDMSTKLYRLETIMNRIFEQAEKQPESQNDLRKFMSYYLPTTEKLLSAYVELDRQPVSGDNIVKTRQEIEGVLDTINDAFEKVLDGMFQDMAWDVSSDISVMKTMMKQDGLMEKELEAVEK